MAYPLRPSSAAYIRPLTGLRAVAAMMVYLHHFNPAQHWPLPASLAAFITEMHTGVSIFFTLSGFLIAYRYADQASGQPAFLRRYLGRRFARIYPLYLLLTVLTLYFARDRYRNFQHLLTAAVLNASLLRGFSAEYAFTGIPQGWSLTVEECFYLFAVPFFVLLRRLRPTGRLALWLGTPLALLGLGLGLMHLTQAAHLPVLERLDFVVPFTFFGRSTEFLVGAALGWWLRRRPLPAAPRWPLTYAALGLLALLLLALARVTALDPARSSLLHPAGMVLNNGLFPLAVALLLFGLTTEPTWLARLLASRPLQVLGFSSYAFYLVHLGIFKDALGRFLPENTIGGYLAILLLLWLLAIGLYYLVERPLNRWLRGYLAAPNA